MLLSIRKSGEQDKERSKEWLVNVLPKYKIKEGSHQPWESSMNISYSTSYIAAVQGEISPVRNKSVYVFFVLLKDENFNQILCHFIDETLNLMKKINLRYTEFLSLFNHFPNKPCFLRVCSKSVLQTLLEKKKLLITNNFSFSRSVFFLFGQLSAIFIKVKIFICKLF